MSENAVISEGQYCYLKRRVNELENKLSEILFMLRQEKAGGTKHLLSFEECVPPASICKDALSMLGVNSYDGMLRFLSDYYGIMRMRMYHNPKKVSKPFIASYHTDEGTAYTVNRVVDQGTVLHEFFHHLHNMNVVMIDDEQDEEKLAAKYAKTFLERAR